MMHSLTRKGGARPQVPELVINWHITEACNYSCRYCYAHWDKAGRELIHHPQDSIRLLEALFRHFDPDNDAHPLREHMSWQRLRLNLAGGEPLLYPERVHAILQAARRIGFSTSMITNGSLLSPSVARRLAPHLGMLGVSLDSGIAVTNGAIGRQDKRGRLLPIPELELALWTAANHNSRLQVKMNTVVTALNCHEDLSALITRLSPQRWKVLRMLPVTTNALAVSEVDFQDFVARHRHLGAILCAEDNTDMVESYLMIDPHGRFFQNAPVTSGYGYSPPILDVGVEQAFEAVRMNAAKFCARYLAKDEGDAA